MSHKLKSQRGETLAEVMASLLIAALSVALLFTCVMASAGIDRAAREADEAYYKALTAAETQTVNADFPAKAGTLKIENGTASNELNITLYGGEGMYTLAAEGTGP